MEYIFMAVIFFVFVAALFILKFLNLSAGLTTAIIFLLLMLAIYSLARVQPKEIKNEKDIKN
jgi:hypothetical protein